MAVEIISLPKLHEKMCGIFFSILIYDFYLIVPPTSGSEVRAVIVCRGPDHVMKDIEILVCILRIMMAVYYWCYAF